MPWSAAAGRKPDASKREVAALRYALAMLTNLVGPLVHTRGRDVLNKRLQEAGGALVSVTS